MADTRGAHMSARHELLVSLPFPVERSTFMLIFIHIDFYGLAAADLLAADQYSWWRTTRSIVLQKIFYGLAADSQEYCFTTAIFFNIFF